MDKEIPASVPIPPQRRMVVRYWYKWSWQKPNEEPEKPRPCLIMSAEKLKNDDYRVHLVPLTHIPQDDPLTSVSMDWERQKGLYLPERTWLKTEEHNKIPRWSMTDRLENIEEGPKAGQCIYGKVDWDFFDRVTASISHNMQRQHFQSVTRRIIDQENPNFRQGRGFSDDR